MPVGHATVPLASVSRAIGKNHDSLTLAHLVGHSASVFVPSAFISVRPKAETNTSCSHEEAALAGRCHANILAKLVNRLLRKPERILIISLLACARLLGVAGHACTHIRRQGLAGCGVVHAPRHDKVLGAASQLVFKRFL